MGYVAKNISGFYPTPRTVEEPGASKKYVDIATLKGVVYFLNKQLFTTP